MHPALYRLKRVITSAPGAANIAREREMATEQNTNLASRALRGLAAVGGSVAAATLRPLGGVATGVASAALETGITVERRAVSAILDSDELERIIGAVLESPRIRDSLKQAMTSDTMKELIAAFFDSGLFDEFADRLLESRGLWRMIDEIAASPAVTAAITQQSLGFADQVTEEARTRSRRADDWLERFGRRLTGRRDGAALPPGDEPQPELS